MAGHSQTIIHQRDGEPIEVDEKLAPFLKILWDHGIGTMMSCQDNPEGSGRIWVNFSSVGDAVRFLKLAVPHPNDGSFPPECLYNRVYSYWFPEEWPRSDMEEYEKSVIDFGLWDWRCHLMDINFIMGDDTEEEHFVDLTPWPDFDISVRFPFRDIEELTKNIVAAD